MFGAVSSKKCLKMEIYTECCRWNDPLQVENAVNRILSCEQTKKRIVNIRLTSALYVKYNISLRLRKNISCIL